MEAKQGQPCFAVLAEDCQLVRAAEVFDSGAERRRAVARDAPLDVRDYTSETDGGILVSLLTLLNLGLDVTDAAGREILDLEGVAVQRMR